jgi:hypothetical protein
MSRMQEENHANVAKEESMAKVMTHHCLSLTVESLETTQTTHGYYQWFDVTSRIPNLWTSGTITPYVPRNIMNVAMGPEVTLPEEDIEQDAHSPRVLGKRKRQQPRK